MQILALVLLLPALIGLVIGVPCFLFGIWIGRLTRRRHWAVLCGAALVALVVGAAMAPVPPSTQRADTTRTAPDSTAPAPPADPVSALRTTIEADTLSDNIRTVRLQGLRLVVEFVVAENLTTGMMVRGARNDVAAIAEAAARSAVDFDSLFVAGYAGMVDRYGNESQDRVIRAVFQRSELAKVNWINFLSDNIYQIADSADLHPEFR